MWEKRVKDSIRRRRSDQDYIVGQEVILLALTTATTAPGLAKLTHDAVR